MQARDYLNRVTYMTPDGTARHVTYEELRAQDKGPRCRQCGDMTTFANMSEVRAANHAAGQHWFSPETMRFFRSRIGKTLYGGRYFVSSEQYDYDAPRLYTVREVLPDGSINTVGDFQGYATSADARRAIRKLLSEPVAA